MQAEPVFTPDAGFQATALDQADVAVGEGVVQSQSPGDLAGHAQVSASRHSEIQLGEKEDIAVAHARMAFKTLDHSPNLQSPFYVPGGCPQRRRSPSAGRCQVLANHR